MVRLETMVSAIEKTGEITEVTFEGTDEDGGSELFENTENPGASSSRMAWDLVPSSQLEYKLC